MLLSLPSSPLHHDKWTYEVLEFIVNFAGTRFSCLYFSHAEDDVAVRFPQTSLMFANWRARIGNFQYNQCCHIRKIMFEKITDTS